jgi:hypothetical protein
MLIVSTLIDAIMVLAGKLRKLWDSLSELCSLCVKDWKGQFQDLHYYLSKLCSSLNFSVRYNVAQ